MEIERRNENNIIGKLKAVILLMLVFTALFLIIFRYGEMINLNYDITRLNNELREKTGINSALYAELDKQVTINDIKYTAETKLDMNKPRNDQIIYINTKLSDDYNSKEKDNFYTMTSSVYERINHTFKNIVEIFKGSNE